MDKEVCSPPLVPCLISSVIRLDSRWFDGELDNVVDGSWVLENENIRLRLLSVWVVVHFYWGERPCVLLGVCGPTFSRLDGVESLE